MNKKIIKYVTEIIRCPDFEYGKFEMGTLLHEAYCARLKNQGYEIEKEVYKTYENYLLIGKVDAINEEEVIEIKTGKNPQLIYLMQLGIYMNMCNRQKGKLIMIANNIREFPLNEPLSDSAILALIKNESRPKWGWECKKCRKRLICPYISGTQKKSWRHLKTNTSIYA